MKNGNEFLFSYIIGIVIGIVAFTLIKMFILQ